jgi:hypothetical protein
MFFTTTRSALFFHVILLSLHLILYSPTLRLSNAFSNAFSHLSLLDRVQLSNAFSNAFSYHSLLDIRKTLQCVLQCVLLSRTPRYKSTALQCVLLSLTPRYTLFLACHSHTPAFFDAFHLSFSLRGCRCLALLYRIRRFHLYLLDNTDLFT